MKLIQTCSACPEQYDVFDETDRQVGYLRLRHGHFTAQLDSPSGETVYEADTIGDGIFDQTERHLHLRRAMAAIAARRSLL